MATPSASQALEVPGRFCLNPSNLATAYPHGGTALGLHITARFVPRVRYHEITAEEHGGAMVDAVYSGHGGILTVIFQGWDADAVTNALLNVSAGATTGRPVWSIDDGTDAVRAGALASTKAAVLYFSPDADQHPGVLLYHAIPLIDGQTSIAFSVGQRYGIPISWHAAPSSSGVAVAVGLREDLTL